MRAELLLGLSLLVPILFGSLRGPDTLLSGAFRVLPRAGGGEAPQEDPWKDLAHRLLVENARLRSRLLALAEAAWTPKNRKDYTTFEQRLRPHLPRLRDQGFTIYDPFTNSPEVTR